MLQSVNFALIQKRLDAYERLIRLDKPIGILLLLWPTLWAVWIAARGWPPRAFVITPARPRFPAPSSPSRRPPLSP